jgi:hypothetical protein
MVYHVNFGRLIEPAPFLGDLTSIIGKTSKNPTIINSFRSFSVTHPEIGFGLSVVTSNWRYRTRN